MGRGRPRRFRLAVLTIASLGLAVGCGGSDKSDGSGDRDDNPPDVSAETLPDRAELETLEQPLVFSVVDEDTGVDWDRLRVSVAGHDPQVDKAPADDQVTLRPQSSWSEGEVSVTLVAVDEAGNETESTFVYLAVDETPLRVDIQAQSTSGPAPLTVTFDPDVETTSAIEKYEWDFTGDGRVDATDVVGRVEEHRYGSIGTYDATLTVEDSNGNEETASVAIEVVNPPPEVSASASPSNGSPPLTVTFKVDATDRTGIDTYEWDFSGDGEFERTTSTGTTEFTYDEAGTFQPRIRVTDELGATTTVEVPSVEVRVASGAPTVDLAASPTAGEAPLAVDFSVTVDDPEDGEIAEWRWDFDGDGDFETTGDSSAITHEYDAAGTFFPRVQVRTADGRTSSDVAEVEVLPEFALTLSDDTFEPTLGEAVTVDTTLSARTRVSLVVEDASGRRVATLVPWTERAGGDYSDTWDGVAESDGEIVSEGEYHIVLLYEVDGEEHRFDLAETTGGDEYNPERNRLPSSFEPFAGDPLEVEFTLPVASRVTAFVGRFDVDTRLVTFFQREPMGRGNHVIHWTSTTEDGALILPPDNDRFLFGIFGFEFADNAVFVRSGVHVTNVEATPPIVMPEGVDDATGLDRSRLEFELNRSGDVLLAVRDMDSGALVDRQRYQDLDAGRNTIEWEPRDFSGNRIDAGSYRLGLAGVDERGAQTPARHVLQRIYY